MRYRLLLFFLLMPCLAKAQQVIINETFEDGDFTINPEWVGDINEWTIVEEDSNNLLRLNGDSQNGGNHYLSTASISNFGSWEFYVRLDGFATSNNNRAHFYLTSDRPDLTGAVNGYAVRIGESGGNKFFRIVRFDEGEQGAVLVSGTTLIEQNIPYRVRVTRSNEGEWALFVATGDDSDFEPEGTPAIDLTYTNSQYIGVRARYTATRFDRFFFDDIVVTKDPLFVSAVNTINPQTLDIVFSEAVNPSSVTPSNFSLSGGIGNPQSTEITVPNTVRITFSDDITGGNYELSVSGVEDMVGGIIEPAVIPFVLVNQPQPGDIVINEFFYSTPSGLAQYVELFNNTDKFFNLKDWRIQDNTATVRRLTTNDFFLGAGEFVVLTGDTISVANEFGTQNFLELSNFPSLNRAAPDQIKIFTSDEVLIDSLRYEAAIWGGSGVALERISPDAISYSPENWADSFSPAGGTPGVPNDTQSPNPNPLTVQDVSYTDSETIVITFDRHVDKSTGQTASNYSLSGGLSIERAIKPESNTITLELSTPMVTNTTYTLTISGVETIFGVPIPETTQEFLFFVVEEAVPGDVVINEFMYNVAPGFSRYIELFNTSNKAIDIAGWTTNNDTGNRNIITNAPAVIPPGGFVVLAPDASLLSMFPDIDLINMGTRFQALKINGDNVVLRDNEGVLFDSLTYTPDWGGNGVALERRRADVSAIYRENWGNSPDPRLGTPGEPNAIPPDETNPEFVSANALTEREITLIFSKSMDPVSAENPANFTLSPSMSIQNIVADKEVIRLQLSADLIAGTTYEVNIQNLTDIFGNPLAPVTANFTFLEFADAELFDVVINEILYRPVAGEAPRFIELYNRSGRNIDLQGWQLGRSTATILLNGPGNTIPLADGEFLVISEDPELLGVPSSRALQVSTLPAFSQNGDAVFIRTNEGTLIDSLRYSPSWGGSPAGFSLERIDFNAASNDPVNWSTSLEGFTAGFENSIFQPDETPPLLHYARRVNENMLLLRFDKFIILDESTQFSFIPEGSGNTFPLDVESFNVFNGNEIMLLSSSTLPEFTRTSDEFIQVGNFRDVAGNFTLDDEIPVAQPISAGDVVINEIMYQPISGSPPDQSEYVEFYNTQNFAIDLEGFRIHDEPDSDGNMSSIIPVSTTSAWIPSDGYVVIHGDPNPDFLSTRLSRFFELDDGRFVYRADRSSLSLSTQGDSIYLAMEDGSVIDSVFYEPSWHNPNLVDVRGISLERINPLGPSNDAANWGSSVVSKGGTPLLPNTLFAEPGEGPDEQGFTVEPNPFSPDGDGIDDNLFINYKLDEPDYLLRVQIFDRYGRLVRTLADGRPAGFEGTLIWDGRRDSGQENRIGIYVIKFEAYNSTSGRNRTFTKSVVLARQL